MWFKITLVFIALLVGFASFVWLGSDSIGKAAISSRVVLATVSIRDNESIASWFEKYHGEAPRHQTMISLAAWCIDSPNQCKPILAILNDKTLTRLKWAAQDSGQENEMKVFFDQLKIKNDS